MLSWPKIQFYAFMTILQGIICRAFSGYLGGRKLHIKNLSHQKSSCHPHSDNPISHYPGKKYIFQANRSNLLSRPLFLNQGQTTEYWIIPISSVPEAPRGHLITMKGTGSESTQKRRNRDQRPHGYTAPEGIVAPSWSSHWREGNLHILRKVLQNASSSEELGGSVSPYPRVCQDPRGCQVCCLARKPWEWINSLGENIVEINTLNKNLDNGKHWQVEEIILPNKR